MTRWTRESLAAHRARMGWPSLDQEASDQVVSILNDAQEKLATVGYLSGIEPATVFVASNRGKAGEGFGS